jgi:hypothetical protein
MTPSQRIATAIVTVVALSGAAIVVVKGRTARGASSAPAGSVSAAGADRVVPVNVAPAVV